MGDLRSRRLERLEDARERRTPQGAPPGSAEDRKKERWLSAARVRRSNATHSRAELHAHDVFRVLRKQGELDGMDIEGVRARIKGWRPPLDGHAVDRVTARAAHDGEAVAEGLACPPEWRNAFEAAERVLERYLAAPPEAFAELYFETRAWEDVDGEEEEDRLSEPMVRGLGRLGITEEREREAVGPDVYEIPEEEYERRVAEILADFYCGEKGYQVSREIARLASEREGRES